MISTDHGGDGTTTTDDDWYLATYAEAFFVSRYNRVEFVHFEERIACLAWLRLKLTRVVDSELSDLRKNREAGTYRVPGWEYESGEVLREAEGLLEGDVRQVSSGVIMLSSVAALESLMNLMLDEPGDERLRKGGLTPKARKLAQRWHSAIDGGEFLEHIVWLSTRRNSFAHSLIDDADVSWPPTPPASWDFDDEMAEDALARVSAVAMMLEEGREQHLALLGGEGDPHLSKPL